MANTKPQRLNCHTTFDPLAFDTLQRITTATGLSTLHIIGQLLNAHMPELCEYAQWIERQDGDTKVRGIHLLASYDLHSLTTEMQRIDPTYQPREARLATAALTSTEAEGLGAMLTERKAK